MSLRVVNGLEWVRSHPERFFRSGSPEPMEIVCHLLCGALSLAARCRVYKEDEGWWVVAGDPDWLGHADYSPEELFARVVPAPEQGVNSMRREVIASAFANAVATHGEGGWLLIAGELPNPEIQARVSQLADTRRAILFRM